MPFATTGHSNLYIPHPTNHNIITVFMDNFQFLVHVILHLCALKSRTQTPKPLTHTCPWKCAYIYMYICVYIYISHTHKSIPTCIQHVYRCSSISLQNPTDNQQVTPKSLLGGSWDLVTTYNWAYNPNHNSLNNLVGVTPKKGREKPSYEQY